MMTAHGLKVDNARDFLTCPCLTCLTCRKCCSCENSIATCIRIVQTTLMHYRVEVKHVAIMQSHFQMDLSNRIFTLNWWI